MQLDSDRRPQRCRLATGRRHGSAVSISVSHRSVGAGRAAATNGNRFVAGVQQHQQRVADDPLAALVDFVDRVAVEAHAEAADVRRVPRLVGHLPARRIEPGDVEHVGAADAAALEELAAAQHRMIAPDADHAAREVEERPSARRRGPSASS